MEIEFQGQYDKTIIFKAIALANKPSKRNELIRIGLALLSVVLFAIDIVVETHQYSLPPFDSIWATRYILVFLVVAYILLIPFIASNLTARRVWKNPALRAPLAGAISSQGVAYISTTKGRRDLPWETFIKKNLSEEMITLVSSAGVLSIFPRSFFKSDSDWNTVRLWVLQNVVEGKRTATQPEDKSQPGQ